MADEIRIRGLEVYANHGVYPEETRLGQRFTVDLELYTDTRRAGLADELELSVDYGAVCHFVSDWLREHSCKLIESAAERCAMAVLERWELLEGLALELHKPSAPIGLPFADVSVRIERFWRRAYVALGSNLGDRRAYLEGAVRGLAALPGCRVKAVSEFIETEPFGYTEQPRFLNGCLALDTLLPPLELLDELQRLEQAALRERKLHWGPRTLDLDLLFYEDLKMDSARLTLPHPGIAERDFVLRPLAEIAPDLVHPVLGKPIRRLLAELEEKQ